MKVNGSSSSLRPNITELDIESHSHLSNLTASQEIENLKRMNHVLTETVASLEEDNKTFREKELRDRETEINEWVGEMQKTTDRDFFREKKLLEFEFEKKRARDEVVEWKNRYCELEARVSKLIDETVAEFERKEREVQEMIAEVEEENRELKARALRVSEERCTLGGKRYYEEENFHAKEKEKEHIEIDDEDDDEIPPRHSTKKRLAEGSHSSKECFVSPKPTEFKRNGWKRASFGGEHVQTPLGSVTKEQEESNKVPRWGEKLELTDLRCSSSARRPGSTGFHGDAGRGIRGCRKSALDRRSMRSFDKQKYWVYTGRTPTTEQRIHAEKRAQIFQKSLRSHSPSFIRSMVPSHVSGRFWFCLPSKFCKENLPAHDLKMILEDERGSEYKVKYIGHRAAIDGGWKRFVLAHKLELDDVLVFELQKPTRFKVYIIKAIPWELCEDSDLKIANGRTNAGN